jgi:hypothetical protein
MFRSERGSELTYGISAVIEFDAWLLGYGQM